ncbi:FAD binding protein domain-containing protein [Sporothrix brasiliensis 5110]|uniref:FAD binding protein domain-containing protein n=1 Tax=Sporothrix brasiliensis 5110 TaxID=1398154 RepID=A0A0C2FLQ4_9PEZI|nr:FAD binding protein domain-containing protein [Sporothrix brasiliensis 5110]KIH92013.1 FAD binding protein domain-containing protein [Sporothrix brasiliensis 5110]
MQLSLGLLTAAAAGSLASPHLARANTTTCKCYADQSCWPTDSRWKALNQAVQGRLVNFVPPAAACYPTYGNATTANADACTAIQANWTNANWIVDQSAQTFSNFWNNNSCSAAADKCGDKCAQGLSPSMIVTANNQFDVQVSVNFARIQNLRLVIRNTGHDYLGRSAGFGSLALNTHRLNNIQFVKSYTGPGNYTGGAVKVGAGVLFRDLYPAAKAEGVDVVGAESMTVGISGGYVQGGGHSPLSGLYGMASDNVLAFDAILASGKQVQINSESNSDLFWALKGGGPGTFAAITGVTVKTHPVIACTGATLSIAYNQPSFWKAVAAFHNQTTALVDAGIYAAYTVTKAGGLTVRPFVAPNITIDQFSTMVEPLVSQLATLNVTYTLSKVVSYPTFDDLYHALFSADADAGGGNTLLSGRLFSKDDVTKNGAAINSAIGDLVNAGHTFVGVAVNPGHAVPDPDSSVSAVHPVWRNAATSTFWKFEPPACLSEAGRLGALQNLTRLGDALRKASPGSAVYANEGNANEPNWQETFWGANYKKLYDIKIKYDPSGVFWAPATPGAELWALVDEKQLCKSA